MTGAGAIILGGSIGSGEWLIGPSVTAQFTAALLWVATASILLQWVFNEEACRYTLYTGEPIMSGFMRTKPGPAFWGWVYSVLGFLQLGWPGWAAGGGHSLHVVCDLTLASEEHAKFKQTDADVGSFDGGYGSAYLARQVGQKFAREIFFLGRTYSAEEMHKMGAVNAVVPHAELETTALQWAREINGKSPTAQRMLKYAFNLIDDGLVGQQLFAGETTRLAYLTDEAVEGRDAFLEKRDPDWSNYPYYF